MLGFDDSTIGRTPAGCFAFFVRRDAPGAPRAS
jgi:hypothetical protein